MRSAGPSLAYRCRGHGSTPARVRTRVRCFAWKMTQGRSARLLGAGRALNFEVCLCGRGSAGAAYSVVRASRRTDGIDGDPTGSDAMSAVLSPQSIAGRRRQQPARVPEDPADGHQPDPRHQQHRRDHAGGLERDLQPVQRRPADDLRHRRGQGVDHLQGQDRPQLASSDLKLPIAEHSLAGYAGDVAEDDEHQRRLRRRRAEAATTPTCASCRRWTSAPATAPSRCWWRRSSTRPRASCSA